MAAFKKKSSEKIVLDKVPADKTKIRFSIQFFGEYDFNRDIAGGDYSSTLLVHEIRNQNISFKEALMSNTASFVFSNTEDVFDKYLVTSFECSKEVEDSFNAAKEKHCDVVLKAKKAELAELEAKVANLKNQLASK